MGYPARPPKLPPGGIANLNFSKGVFLLNGGILFEGHFSFSAEDGGDTI